ncbi:MAG: flagellar hook-basal body complex protein [Planctomycetaceae bacterium]|jgi:flagellar hook protein FlgE|nr:flagellar hook-basal body complex protein [Planctomycetaceae bacterium]
MSIGLNSALNVASMGLGAAEKTIAVIGNNLANANTIGFKSGRADFATMLSYDISYGSQEGVINTAGSNPIQIGEGVRLAGVSTSMTQGTIKGGMGKTDLAISGEGMFIVSNALGTQQYYTRNGVMKLNGNQKLVTEGGMYIMGYGVDENFNLQKDRLTQISIPVNKLNIAEASENVWMEGILNATGDSATQGSVTRTKQMTDLSWSSPASDEKLSATLLTRPATDGITNATGVTGGAVESGNYIYRFAFVDANGVESDYSSPVEVTVANGQNAVSLTSIPSIPAGSNYSSIRVYRATNEPNVTEPVFYEVGEFDPSTQTPPGSYTDTKSNAEIVDASKTLNINRLNGSYQYYVTYVDAMGNESRPSAISDVVNVNRGGQVELNGIPSVAPANNPDNWTTRRVYRTLNGEQSTFYLVGQIDDMNPSSTLIDRVSDAQLVKQPVMSLTGNGNVQANDGTLLVNLGEYLPDGTFKPAFEVGTLEYTPHKGDTTLTTQSLVITDKTTVLDYLTFLNNALGIRTGGVGSEIAADKGTLGSTINGGSPGAVIQDGAFYIVSNSGTGNAISVDLNGANDFVLRTADGRRESVSLGWANVQDAIGESTTTTLTVYDSLGAPVSVKLSLVLESKSNTETTYRWYADSPDNQPTDGFKIDVGTGLITFDQNGKLIDGGSPQIAIERTNVASVSPASFSFLLDVGGVAALSTSSATLKQTAQDGAAAGTMYDYSIQDDGTIIGIFSGDTTRVIGQIALATFANPEGLFDVGGSLFQQTMNSGAAIIRDPGSMGAGQIVSNSLEMSNVDIGQNLIDMISASAMYRANTKVLTTSNEMFDSLLQVR